MSDSNLRRIELKSQMLSSEIIRLELSGRSLASALKKQEQNNRVAEKSWTNFLRKTISSYKNAPQKLQSQILTSNLKTLSDTKKQITKQKGAEQNLRNRLESLLRESKRKEIQLAHFQNKKRHNLELKARIKDQNINDELVALRSVKIKSKCIYNLNDIIKCSEPLKNPEKVENQESNRKISDFENEDLNSTASIVEQTADLSACSALQSSTVIVSTSFEKDDNSLLRQDSSFSDSGNRQRRWESAKESQELISQQNEAVTVSVLQTSAGDTVCIDYQISPGRMLSLEANQGSELKNVAINLNASKERDRVILNNSRSEIITDLKNRGVSISKLEVL